MIYTSGMGMESGHDKHKDQAILAQVALAQMAAHTTDRHKAMEEWLAGGDDSLAAHFRKLIDEHPEVLAEAKDEPSMSELLEKVRTYH